MSVKIKISYEDERELEKVLHLLAPVLKRWTRAPKSGRFFRAYIILKG